MVSVNLFPYFGWWHLLQRFFWQPFLEKFLFWYIFCKWLGNVGNSVGSVFSLSSLPLFTWSNNKTRFYKVSYISNYAYLETNLFFTLFVLIFLEVQDCDVGNWKMKCPHLLFSVFIAISSTKSNHSEDIKVLSITKGPLSFLIFHLSFWRG